MGLLLVILAWNVFPANASNETEKKLILGAPTPLLFFGNPVSDLINPENVFGIVSPCTASTPMGYSDLPCIRALQYRSKGSGKWLDARISQTSLAPLVELMPGDLSRGGELTETRGSDDRWYLNSGSSSLWESPPIAGDVSTTNRIFIVEATVASRVLPKTFSLSLIPVEITTELSNDLSDVRQSFFRRVPFPENHEFQILIKESQRMQPLQFVTSRTKNANLVRTIGRSNSLDIIFSGEPSSHSILESDYKTCADPLMVKVMGSTCEFVLGDRWKVYPWDRAITDFLSEDYIENFREKATTSDWSFQGGQDAALIIDFVQGCSYSNVFSLTATNAPVYHVNPPRWDKTDSSLSVKIANTHLKSDSQLQRGFFSIRLKLSSAACMWGIDRNNVSASVEILSENGLVQNVATSSIKIDEEADQVSINLSGFTFSSPTIKIKLSEKTSKSKVASTPASSKKKITCAKGKQRLTVAAAKGCPTGFKRI